MLLKKGLQVKVLTGKDKGKDGEIIQVDRSRGLAKIKALNMIKNRYISTLLTFTNKELLEGLKEINLKYKKNMMFKDKLICLIL